MRPLESTIRHEIRLGILGRLVYGGPRTTVQLSEEVAQSLTQISYHLGILKSHYLVDRSVDRYDVYEATLTDHPDWVQEAVTAYQFTRRIRLRLPSSALLGLKCDRCDRLFRYKEKVVAVYDDDGTIRARVVTEDTPGSSEAEELGASTKHHKRCYEEAQGEEPGLPFVEPEN